MKIHGHHYTPAISDSHPSLKSTLIRYAWHLLSLFTLFWIIISYFALPYWWKKEIKRHPAMLTPQRITTTSCGIAGDPLNLLIVGTRAQLVASMLAAGWHSADPITLESCFKIVQSSIFHQNYLDAPVSDLFLFNRREDLAFEKLVGGDARKRHHIRFWEAPQKDSLNRSAWWATATFDKSVGFSYTTGQITHHIAAEIDAERDGLISSLTLASRVKSSSLEPGLQALSGYNGGGDLWRSDGALGLIELQLLENNSVLAQLLSAFRDSQ